MEEEWLFFAPQRCKFREHHRRSVGVLWAFGGFLQTRLYNNAAKIFGAEGILCRRFVNVAIKRHLKQAEGVDYQRLPLGCFFCYFFLSAEDFSEGFKPRARLYLHFCIESVRALTL